MISFSKNLVTKSLLPLIMVSLLFAIGFIYLDGSPSVAETSEPAVSSFTCTPVQVAVFPGSASLQGGRIHVRCAEVQAESISFFALATQEISSSGVLSLLQDALVSGKKLGLFYNTDASSNPLGCLQQDCRKIEGVVLLP
ncbi:hypothetical protein HY229_04600 [Candidatus Acetothermia bacterium]|nr:hypothetical protein [Candidatus Acetothermia bacterium]MBI3643365.1 hypothetical protein [Candidatus Acetothermia bacterium]